MAKEVNTIFVELDENADLAEYQAMHNLSFPGNQLATFPSVNNGKIIVKVACPVNRTMTGAMTLEEAKLLFKPSETL